MKNRFWASGVAIVLVTIVVGAVLFGTRGFLARTDADDAAKKPAEAASRTTRIDGSPAITLDASRQKSAGLEVRQQTVVARRNELQALGTVLSLRELTALRTDLVTAKTQADAADAAAAASGADYRRLRTLRDQENDVSDKTLQAAEATWRADQAKASAAQAAANATKQTAIQQWGTELVRAATANAPMYVRLSAQQNVLVQVALPVDAAIGTAPATVRIRTPRDTSVSAQYVGAAARTDPRLQGASYFYAAAPDGLLPGASLTVFLPIGAETQGAVIPASAIVWWQGRAWVYTQHDGTHFVRRELPADQSTGDGWFVPQGFANSESIVVTGAQLLFSEELKAQTSSGEDTE